MDLLVSYLIIQIIISHHRNIHLSAIVVKVTFTSEACLNIQTGTAGGMTRHKIPLTH
jgi:hypothetical protein